MSMLLFSLLNLRIIGDVKPEAEKKRRGRRKKSEIEAEQKEN